MDPSVLLGLSQGSSPTASGWTSGHAPKSAPLGRHWRGGRLRSRSRRATRTGAGRRGRPARRAPRRPPRAARRGRGLSIILGFGRAREVRAAGDELEVLSPTRLLHLPRLPVDGPVEFAAHRKRPFRSRALRRSLESVRTRPSPGLSSMRWRGMVITTTTCMYMLVNDGSIRTAMWVGLMA